MFSKRVWMIACIALLALLVLGVVQAWAILTQDFTAENADHVAGWSWLREKGDSASWEFGAVPEAELPAKPGRCELRIKALVTPMTGGGSGHDKHLTMILRSGAYSHSFPVFLHNEARLTKTDSQGAGYGAEAVLSPSRLTRGSDKIALKRLCRTYSETGVLTVDYAWRPSEEPCCHNDPEYPHHVAVSSESVQVTFN